MSEGGKAIWTEVLIEKLEETRGLRGSCAVLRVEAGRHYLKLKGNQMWAETEVRVVP